MKIRFVTVPKEGAAPHPMQGHRGKHQNQAGGRRSKRKAWARAFAVVSVGKARKGRISRLKIG